MFFDFVLAGFSGALALYLYKNPEVFASKLPDFLWIPAVTVIHSIKSFFAFFTESRDFKESKNEGIKPYLLRGVLIAVPTFLVLLLLLTSADPIFGKLAGDFSASIGERSIASIAIFVLFFAAGLTQIKGIFSKEEKALEVNPSKVHELSIVLGSITALFAAFIIVQFKYLFSGAGERELASLGIKSLTFSEYVNKGFFELLVVAVVTSFIILYALQFIHKFKGQSKLLVQIFASVVTIETLLILLSDVKRLMLYTSAHGLTRARVFGFVFLIWLTVFLAILIFRTVKNLGEKWFLNGVLALTIIAFTSINLINIDGLIAEKYKPTVNGEIDYYYLASLSSDGASSWVPALKDAEIQINALEKVQNLSDEDFRRLNWADRTLYSLDNKIEYLNKNYASFKWQSLNYSEYLAYRVVSEDKTFNTVPDLIKRASVLYSRVNDSIKQNGPILDRSVNPPLSY